MTRFLLFLFFLSFAVTQAQRQPFVQTQVEDQSDLKKGESIDDKIRKNFFLKADVTKTSCYVGEPIMATYKAYSRLNANSRVMKRPALTGFSVMEMVDSYSNESQVEVLKGIAYNTHLIRKVQLFPLLEGTFVLEPAQVQSQIFLRNPGTLRSITLETPPVSVSVKALPSKNQPDSFSGAVGSYSVKLQMKDREIAEHDPALVELVVSGTGNLPLITDPEISWPKGVQVSPPQVTEDVNKYIYPLSGSKVFEYRIEVDRVGQYAIPPISFSYFDPSDATYKTVLTDEVKFNVAKAKRKMFADKIIRRPDQIPLQYYYFGIIGLGILAWIIIQIMGGRRKK